MSYFSIEGGRKLQGQIAINASKNAALAILAAALMIPGESSFINVPQIEEVKRLLEVISSLGVRVKQKSRHSLALEVPKSLNLAALNKEAFQKTRAGILLLGALSARQENFSLPFTGGCQLGKRTVNPHILALERLGVKVKKTEKEYLVTAKKLRAAEIVMYESGDTATENVLMAASLAKGETKIFFGSTNYMVRDLANFLQAAGAQIKEFTAEKIIIEGKEALKPVQNYSLMPDPIEAMTLISLAITTQSPLLIKGCPLAYLRLELEKLRVMGQKFQLSPSYKSPQGFTLTDIKIIPSRLRALPDKIYGRPYPGLNIDNLPLFLPILTQARGATLVHDWCYENRAIYYTELNRLGANIMLHDPHRVTVFGPTPLRPAEVICPPALRPAINLLTCMLAARGKSILRNAYPIDRGYENIVQRLRKLGAQIKRLKEED